MESTKILFEIDLQFRMLSMPTNSLRFRDGELESL